MRKKPIIILGASPFNAKSILAARNSGYFVIALDRNPESAGFLHADIGIPCDIIDFESVYHIAEKYRVEGIVPVNDHGVMTAALVAEKLGLPGISPGVALLATNKEEMRKAWIRKGIPCPAVAAAEIRNEFYEAIKQVGLPCIFKPAHGLGGGSRGVVVVRSEDEIEGAISFSQQFYTDKKTLVESFIDAEVEHSAEVIVYNGVVHVIAISDKVKTPLPYRVDKSVIYPTVITGERLEKLRSQITEAVEALDISIGAAHVELATTADGFVLFELGARCGGGGTPEPIVPFATGVSEFLEVVRILAGDVPANLEPTRSFGCCYHFLTPEPGTLKSIHGLEELQNMNGVLDADIFVQPGDVINPVTVGTERAGYIITGAATREEAHGLAQKAEGILQFEYV